MDPKAIAKARGRLTIAQQQLDAAEHAPDYDAFTGAWYLFLVAAKNVYTTLEQGAKVSAQSRQWFGGKKSERKQDQLLQYLFQARDDDEHGLGDVTRLEPHSVAIGKPAPGFSRSFLVDRLETDSQGNIKVADFKSLDGKPVLVEEIAAHAILIPVTGRGGVKYDPPSEHLGQKLTDNLPITVAKMGLRYLQALLDEAEENAA